MGDGNHLNNPMRSYDPLLFQGTASYYAKYRLGYPPKLFCYLVEHYDLDGTGRLLDLGCGTGQLTIPFASHFKQVVGMDPDGEMLTEARNAVKATGIANVTLIQAPSGELGLQFGQFRLVTMGESFHWMDRDAVLETLYDLVVPEGGVVVVTRRVRGLEPDDESMPAYELVVQEILRRYLGEKRRAGSGNYKHSEDRHETVLQRSSFQALERWVHSYEQDWSIDEIVGHLYSTSYSSKRLFGSRINEFEKELRDRLRQVEPRGVFNTRVEVTALVVRRCAE